MRVRCIPTEFMVGAIVTGAAAALAAIVADIALRTVIDFAWAGASLFVVLAIADYLYSRRAWRQAAPQLTRHLPAAFAIGVERRVQLDITVTGEREWHCRLFDHADSSLLTQGLPMALTLIGGKRLECFYAVRPSRRGEVQFAPADLRVRSILQLWELTDRIGQDQTRRVYPDFAQVARYAWLAGDRRLSQIGIKTHRQRGEGTDFKQLSEYRVGDAVRHIDWKASMRFEKPIVRQFQNERDQCVLLLVDCGRRMRADDSSNDIGNSHFDQVLNATMLLTYVALKHGDAVGALTFGTPPGEGRWFAPRKGAVTLNALMSELYAVQPTPTHSDYLSAAKDLLRRHRKRALVIVITNFRDEDSAELGQALRLLRSRHLVMTASLRERVVRQLSEQPIATDSTAIEIASAIHYEQQRRDAFNAIAARDSLMVDAEPERLSIELVNRYNAVKRAGMI
jgi:uncharacterized protein (DUF58 family)